MLTTEARRPRDTDCQDKIGSVSYVMSLRDLSRTSRSGVYARQVVRALGFGSFHRNCGEGYLINVLSPQ